MNIKEIDNTILKYNNPLDNLVLLSEKLKISPKALRSRIQFLKKNKHMKPSKLTTEQKELIDNLKLDTKLSNFENARKIVKEHNLPIKPDYIATLWRRSGKTKLNEKLSNSIKAKSNKIAEIVTDKKPVQKKKLNVEVNEIQVPILKRQAIVRIGAVTIEIPGSKVVVNGQTVSW